MASFNQLTLLGNCTRDPEIKYLQDGTAVCDIGLAVNETWKDSAGNKKEDVLFIDCTCWRRTAEIAVEYLRKGSPVLLAGKLKQDRWEKDGQKHSKIRMTVERLQLLGSKPHGDQQDQRHDRSEAQTEPGFTPQASPDVGSQDEPEPGLPF